MPRRSAEAPEANRTRHQRRRAQCAEGEAERLRAENGALRAEIAAERAALIAWLDGPGHRLEAFTALQAIGRDVIRRMSERHSSCSSCGGYRREMWDAMMEPVIDELRAEVAATAGLESMSDAPPAPPWPVREGGIMFGLRSIHPFRTEGEREASRRALQEAGLYR